MWHTVRYPLVVHAANALSFDFIHSGRIIFADGVRPEAPRRV